jgi:transposase-like protein
MNAIKGNTPKNLMQAVRYFSDLDVAHEFFAKVRWPDGVCCPHCGSVEVKYLAKYRRFQCSHNHKSRQFTVKTGTVMEDSALGLDKWAVGLWLEVNAKNSVSSYEIHRSLGITQKSAWFMLHRIRLAVQDGSLSKMGGNGSICEADETFIGGKARNMHASRRRKVITGTGGTNKTAVMGLLERHEEKGKSKVRTTVVANRKRETLHDVIHKNVETGSQIFTDALPSYLGLAPNFLHDFVDHAESYAKGTVHTNGLENFWSLFKRCIKGTHVSVEPFHLFRYLDSESFRFNYRDTDDSGRFLAAMQGMSGKRLTYKALTGALEQPPETTGTGQG